MRCTQSCRSKKKKLNWNKVESGTNQNGKIRQINILIGQEDSLMMQKKLPKNWPIHPTTIYQYFCLLLSTFVDFFFLIVIHFVCMWFFISD